MKQSKMLELIKAWKALERRGKDLDFELSKWSAETRGEFPQGATGDRACSQWLETELALPPGKREDLLARARAYAIVSDQAQWDAQGGFVQIRHLIPLSKPERVAVLGAAKASSYRISTIIRNRESRPVSEPRPSDVQLLAEWVESRDDAPDDLREIARRHVRARALKVVA